MRAGVVSAVAAISVAAMVPACGAQAVPAPVERSMPSGASMPNATGSVSGVGAGETLHVMVGHSFLLNTKSPLHRVYVLDPAILSSITLSRTQIIVTAMAPGVTSLILVDEAGEAESYVVSSDVDVEGLRVAMAEAMQGNQVSVDGSGERVILSGKVNSDALADSAVKLAGLYTKDVANAMTVTPSHPKQVRLQVRILEVDRSKLLQQGVNLFNPGGNTSFLASTTTSQYPSTSTLTVGSGGNLGGVGLATSNPLNFFLYSTKLNLGAAIQDLQNKQVLQILAEPSITTISGVKADFLSGGQFPFPVVQPGSGAGGAPIVTIQFRDYGVKVEFTPVVNEDGTIHLTVAPEVSALDYTNAVTVNGINIPALSTRKASSEVELRSGQSYAISGLLDQRTSDLLSKTPGAASIPILGNLFKSKNVNHSTTELVVVVTPTVVDPLSETEEPTEPGLPIPTLDKGSFDKSLGKDGNPNPPVPPVNPAQPASKNQAPAIPGSSTPMQSVADTSKNVVPGAAAPQGAQASVAPGAAVINSAPVAASAQATSSALASAPASAAASRASLSPDPTSAADPISTPVTLVASHALGDYEVRDPVAAPTAGAQIYKTSTPSMVQVMTLSNKQDADAMVAALKRHGYNVAVNHDSTDKLLHLEVGPFKSETDAEAMRQRLVVDGYNATIK